MAVIATVFLYSCDEQGNLGKTDEPADPVLSLQNAQGLALTKLDITAEGGDTTLVVLTNNPFTVACEADWITIDPANPEVKEGVETKVNIKVSVAANTLTDARSATINITSGDLKGAVTVNQAGVENTINWTTAWATWEGAESCWYIDLFDEEYMESDMMSGMAAAFIIAMGEDASFEDGLPLGKTTMDGESAYLELAGIVRYEGEDMTEMYFFTEGYIEISLEGDTYTISARGKDENGNELKADYTGAVDVYDAGGEGGGEDEDMDGDPIDITFNSAGAYFDGIYEGYATWSISLSSLPEYDPASLEGTTGMISLVCDTSATFDKGLPTGTFEINNTDETILNTATNIAYMSMDPFAFGGISNGTVTITKDGDNYTIIATGPVGDGTSTYTYTGPIALTDNSIYE